MAAYEPRTRTCRPDVDRLTLVRELRSAITEGAIDVAFQPKTSLRDRHVHGFEALARWNHPEWGQLLPEDFVPIAEQTGLIDALTDVVVDRALEQVRAWRASGRDLTVSVNVSIRTLRDVTFPERLRATLVRAGIPPRALVLEVTESVLTTDPERVLHVLDRLRALGVGLSVDDLGTGNSSLAYLRRLPVHEVKVDRSFVAGIATDSDDFAVVGTIVQLGHRLGKRVVAEGVEDERSWELLEGMGCDFAQGYWICRPQPAAAIQRWLERPWGTTSTSGVEH